MQINRKRRRGAPSPNKNELRAARSEQEARDRSQSGTLRQRFPYVRQLELEFRQETPSGATLEEISRKLGPDEPLTLNAPCQGGCSGGVFLLTDAVGALLEARKEQREGMGICQAASYNDSKLPCGTKFYYRITASYDPIEEAPAA